MPPLSIRHATITCYQNSPLPCKLSSVIRTRIYRFCISWIFLAFAKYLWCWAHTLLAFLFFSDLSFISGKGSDQQVYDQPNPVYTYQEGICGFFTLRLFTE